MLVALPAPRTTPGLPPRGANRTYPLSPETNQIPCSEQALECRSGSGFVCFKLGCAQAGVALNGATRGFPLPREARAQGPRFD